MIADILVEQNPTVVAGPPADRTGWRRAARLGGSTHAIGGPRLSLG
jgi:hypothetical protein